MTGLIVTIVVGAILVGIGVALMVKWENGGRTNERVQLAALLLGCTGIFLCTIGTVELVRHIKEIRTAESAK